MYIYIYIYIDRYREKQMKINWVKQCNETQHGNSVMIPCFGGNLTKLQQNFCQKMLLIVVFFLQLSEVYWIENWFCLWFYDLTNVCNSIYACKNKRVNENLRVHYQYMAVLQREHAVTVLLNLPQKEQA